MASSTAADSEPSRRADAEKLEMRSREIGNLAVRYARDAAALAADTAATVAIFVEWADSLNSFETHKRPKSLEFVLENAFVESAALIFDEYLKKIASGSEFPADFPGTLLLMTSTADYSSQASLLVEVSQRMLEEMPGDAIAEQAFAWALFRNSAWQQCVDVLGRELQKDNAENRFALAIAFWNLEQFEQAREELNNATVWMEANRKMLTERRISGTAKMHPNIETLGRLKAEAEQIILSAIADATNSTGRTLD